MPTEHRRFIPKSRGLIELISGFFIGNAAVYGFKWIEATRISLIERNNFPVSISPTRWITRFVDTVTSKADNRLTSTRNVNKWLMFSLESVQWFLFFFFRPFTLQPKGKHRWERIGMDRVYVAKNVTKPWHQAAIRNTKENLIVIIRATLLCSGQEVSCKWRFRENVFV